MPDPQLESVLSCAGELLRNAAEIHVLQAISDNSYVVGHCSGCCGVICVKSRHNVILKLITISLSIVLCQPEKPPPMSKWCCVPTHHIFNIHIPKNQQKKSRTFTPCRFSSKKPSLVRRGLLVLFRCYLYVIWTAHKSQG